MTGLPQLRLELQTLIERAEGHRAEQPTADRRALAEGVCRAATAASQAMEELVLPALVHRVDRRRFDAATIEWDLIRVLVHELVQVDPREPLHEGLVAAVARHARARLVSEHGAAGLIAEAIANGLDASALDPQIGDCLAALDAASFWTPLQPAALESLRNSIPPGALPYDEL